MPPCERCGESCSIVLREVRAPCVRRCLACGYSWIDDATYDKGAHLHAAHAHTEHHASTETTSRPH